MRKHTSATPAGIARSRSTVGTRRERKHDRAIFADRRRRREQMLIETAPNIVVELELFELRNPKLRQRPCNPSDGKRYLLSPEAYAEFAEIAKAWLRPPSIGTLYFHGREVVCEPALTGRRFELTEHRTSVEARARELWVRRQAMSDLLEAGQTPGPQAEQQEAFDFYHGLVREMLEWEYDDDQALEGKR